MEFDIEEQEMKEGLQLGKFRNFIGSDNVKFDQFDNDVLRFYFESIEQWQKKRRMETNPVERKEYSEFVDLFIGSGPGPVRDFGTERALVEPLGPNTGNFPNSSTQNGH